MCADALRDTETHMAHAVLHADIMVLCSTHTGSSGASETTSLHTSSVSVSTVRVTVMSVTLADRSAHTAGRFRAQEPHIISPACKHTTSISKQ